MTLKQWRPFSNLLSVQDRVNRLFDNEFASDADRNQESSPVWHPTTDIYETKDDYVVKMEVPGLKREEITIETCENTLSIKGERNVETDVKKESFLRVERYTGKFSRTFMIPREIDSKKINASMKDGILELRLPKTEIQKTRSIPIDIK